MTTPFPFVSGQVLTAEQLNDIQNLPISDKTASYTLLVGDVTKRTIMNSASATTITVDDSIFTESDVIQVANKGAGTCTITAGAGVTINTSGSLDLAQYGGGYLVAISASQFVFFNLGGGGASYGTATGGSSSSITVSGVDYTLLSFTSDDNLVVSTAGLFDVLMIGGGGGGGKRDNSNSAGGGGAGGILQSTIYLDAATYAVDVGAGAAQGRNGLGSSVGNAALSLSVVGGGSGGSSNASTAAGAIGGTGGSGGGSTASNSGGVASINVVTGQAGGAGVTNAGGGGGGLAGLFTSWKFNCGCTILRANRRAVMTSKKISKAKRQIGDQTTKGGVIGIMIYALSTNNVDPVLIGLLVPVASSVLAWVSTKIGDPDLACLFIPNDDDKPKN
jgi:hypothetical protein